MNAASPAPWVIGSNGASVKVVDSDGKAVCMLTPRRDQFNGDLIAAAPDLLAALQMVASIWSQDQTANLDPESPLAKVRAAIKKATGENA
jgi:hypothetical protein